MTEAIMLLIVGATVSLISSLLTSIITHRLRLQADEKARKWALEEKQADQRNEARKLRMHDVEKYAQTYFDLATKIHNIELELLFGPETSTYQNYLDRFAEINSLITQTTALHSSVLILHDAELTRLSQELISTTKSSNNYAYGLLKSIIKKEVVDTESGHSIASETYNKVNGLRIQMLNRLHEIL